MKIAVLDDYQGVATELVDWSVVDGVTVVPFRDHVFDEAELIARLAGFDAIMRIRERTDLTRSVLEALPGLKLILATGMRNARSLESCHDRCARHHGVRDRRAPYDHGARSSG